MHELSLHSHLGTLHSPNHHRRTAALLSLQLWLTRQQMTSHCAPGWQMKLERPESQRAEATGYCCQSIRFGLLARQRLSTLPSTQVLKGHMCCLCGSSIRFLIGWQVKKVKETPKKPWQLVLISLCERVHLWFSCLSKFQFANITFSGYSLKFQSSAAEGRWLGLNCALLNNQVQQAPCFNWLLLPVEAIFLLTLTGPLLWRAQASGHACQHRLWDFNVCWNFTSIRGLHFNRQSYKPAPVFPLACRAQQHLAITLRECDFGEVTVEVLKVFLCLCYYLKT